MKILVVAQYFWPETFRINDLVEGLLARGHQVTVFTALPNYPEGSVFPEFRKDPQAFSRFHGAEVIRVPLIPRGKSSLQLALNYLSFIISGVVLGPWRLRGRAFDAILVFQTSPVTAAVPSIPLRRLKRIPTLMWVLDLWPESLAAVGVVTSPRLLALVGLGVKYIYRHCDRILIQSRAFTANILKYGGKREAIRYFPGWAESLFQDAQLEFPAPELEPYQGFFKILFAGNIGDAQDFPAILDAAESLGDCPQVRWVIVGDGRAAAKVRLEIESRGLQDRVVLLGRFPIERMPSFFQGSDALLVSLRREPIFGMTIPGKVQSYLSSGVPLLGMLDGEGARVIEEAGAGLAVQAGEGRELAQCVRKLLGMSQEERKAMGRRGKAYCAREFDRDTLLGSLEAWMGEAIEESRKPA